MAKAAASNRDKPQASNRQASKAPADRPRARQANHTTPAASKRAKTQPAKAKAAKVVDRVPPSEVVALMVERQASRKAFAAEMGVTVSRVSEWTTPRRPNSHVNRERWPELVAAADRAAGTAK